MTNDPDQIKADIEATRAELSRDVDALAETVRPANVVQRQKDKVTSKVFGAKDAVIGTAAEAKDSLMGSASQAQSSSGDALHSTGETISSAPQMARQRAQGNPLAAGLIALGVGWLVGSLLPATRAERQAADTLKDKAAPLAQEVTDKAKEVAREAAQDLQEPAQQAVQEVKSAGSEAVETVKSEATSTASDVTDTAKEGAQNVKQSRQNG
jgi:gas vesicle protein